MIEEKGSVHLEALLNYLRQGSVEQAYDQAYVWIKDGTLPFSEYKRFVFAAQKELVNQEKRQEMFRG